MEVKLPRRSGRLWLTWEWQRRSIELSKSVNASLYVLEYDGRSLLRYPALIVRTLRLLMKHRPKVLFVQNPSMILSFVSCVYRIVYPSMIIIDRHSNFMLTDSRVSPYKKLIFRILNRFTIKNADLTIVTNKYIAKRIRAEGGKPFVLPDKIPALHYDELYNLEGKYNVLVISSFGKDEPIKEVIHACSFLKPDGVHMYITGNYNKLDKSLINHVPCNLTFTGFLPENKFINMLFSSDVVVVLTTIDECMLCGCYEAYAAFKPLITSKKRVLEEYFDGALFTENTSEAISHAIIEVCGNLEEYKHKIVRGRMKLEENWRKSFRSLTSIIDKISAALY